MIGRDLCGREKKIDRYFGPQRSSSQSPRTTGIYLPLTRVFLGWAESEPGLPYCLGCPSARPSCFARLEHFLLFLNVASGTVDLRTNVRVKIGKTACSWIRKFYIFMAPCFGALDFLPVLNIVQNSFCSTRDCLSSCVQQRCYQKGVYLEAFVGFFCWFLLMLAMTHLNHLTLTLVIWGFSYCKATYCFCILPFFDVLLLPSSINIKFLLRSRCYTGCWACEQERML